MAQDVSSHLSSPVNVGDVVDKYRVERVVGVGAMGLVVAARHTTLDQIVAIKFLVEHRFGSKEESISRFLGEARAAARIESDHVCPVSDVGMLPSGVPFMIMEHLDGNDLEEEIVSRGQLDLAESVDYLLQALDAIAAAHQQGIVHRDLKPANIFLARRPDGSRRVKVLDFGISKATGMGSRQRFTRETRSLGTPAYMPPEQIKDPMNVDHRADIWALGCILYEMLTGQMAFVGDNVKQVLDRVLGEAPCPIPQLRRDVPPELIAITARALERDRDARWATAATFARALASFGSIGVVSGLASIQREVGSLSSISALSSVRIAPAASSVDPMVSSLREVQTQPDPSELSRRHDVVQDWAALQTRRRRARAAVLAMAAALLVASAIAVIAYRARGAPFTDAGAAASSADLPSEVKDPAPPEAPVLPAPALSSSAVARNASKSVHPAASTGRPVASTMRPTRIPVTKPTGTPPSGARRRP